MNKLFSTGLYIQHMYITNTVVIRTKGRRHLKKTSPERMKSRKRQTCTNRAKLMLIQSFNTWELSAHIQYVSLFDIVLQ